MDKRSLADTIRADYFAGRTRSIDAAYDRSVVRRLMLALAIAALLIIVAFHQVDHAALFRPEPPRAARRVRRSHPRHTAPYRARI